MIALPTLEAKKIKLQKDIMEALRDGMAQSFGDNPTPYTYEIASKFAAAAAPGVTDAVYDFITTLIVNIPAAPFTGACAAGPVTGTATVSDPMIMIG